MTRLRLAMAAVAVVAAGAAAAGAAVQSSHGGRLTGDEPYYLITALSLAEDRDLDIGDELAAQRWRDFHEAQLPEQTRPLDGGRRVSPHGPLLPALLAGPAWVGGWPGARLAMAAMAGALAAAVVWLAVRRFGTRLAVAVPVTLALALSPPLAVYGSQLYPEVPAALAVVLGVAAATGPLGRGGRALLVLAVAALPFLAVKYAPVGAAVAAVGLVRLVRRGDARGAALVLIALAGAAVAYVAAHAAWYGGLTPYATGDHFVHGELTAAGHDPDWLGRSRRLSGLLVDRRFGLAAWQPAWLLAVPAVAALATRRPRAWAALAVPLGAGWLTATFVALTMHGWWFPGRQVVVVLPLAAVAVAWWAGRLGRGAARWALAVAAAGCLAFAWLVVEGMAGRLTWAVDFADTRNPLVRVWRLALPDERPPVGWSSEALHAAWSLALGAVGWGAARRARRTMSPAQLGGSDGGDRDGDGALHGPGRLDRAAPSRPGGG